MPQLMVNDYFYDNLQHVVIQSFSSLSTTWNTLGNFSAKVWREVIFKLTIWKRSLHECNEIFLSNQLCEYGISLQRFRNCFYLHQKFMPSFHTDWWWRQRHFLKCWILILYWHGWSPKKTSLHLIATKS